MTKEMTYGTIIFVILTELLVGLAVVVGLDPYANKRRKGLFSGIIVMVFLLIMQNFTEYWLMAYYTNPPLRTGIAILGYSLRPAILLFFAYLVFPKGKHTIAWGLVALNVLMHLTAFFTDIVFAIGEGGWRGGPLNFWCVMTSGILLAYTVGLIIFKAKWMQAKEIFFHAFWVVVIVFGVIADSIWNDDQWVDYLTISITVVTVLSYMWFHQRFVREYEKNFIEEQRMRLVLSQIQPHFIYNTLSSIRSIEGTPEETRRAITEFANYIRGNIAALDEGNELVPFATEMDFVKDYVALQQRRFPGRFEVQYDLEDKDFSLPPLTVQILVENSIKHGILIRYEPGTITVHSHRAMDCHVVKVIDDGVGFDTKKLEKTDRVGVRAVKNRLEYFMGGTVTFESTIGKGTTVTLCIPCEPPAKQK